jgi:hypothetical protein
MRDESNFPLLMLLTSIFVAGIFAGLSLSFDGYKCTDERIENHEIVCYRWEKKP